jgi:hypothetical protein
MHLLDQPAQQLVSPASLRQKLSDIVSLKRGRTAWKIQVGCAEEFLEPTGLRISHWEREGRLKTVKHGPHRTVYRVELPSGTFYLKHYRTPGLRAVLQNILRPCPASLEWRGAHGLARSGLPTFEAIGIGRTQRTGLTFDSYLIGRAIEGVEPLDLFLERSFPLLPARQQRILRKDLAIKLGQLAARMHQAGVLQRDFHAGNLLLRVMPEGAVRLWVIDLHTIRLDRTPSLALVKENFAVFHQFFVGKSTPADRLRFIQAYGAVRRAHGAIDFRGTLEHHPPGQPANHATPPQLIRDIENYCQRAKSRMWNRADRRWSRGNRRLFRLDAQGARCRGLATLDRRMLEGDSRQSRRVIRVTPEILV